MQQQEAQWGSLVPTPGRWPPMVGEAELVLVEANKMKFEANQMVAPAVEEQTRVQVAAVETVQ